MFQQLSEKHFLIEFELHSEDLFLVSGFVRVYLTSLELANLLVGCTTNGLQMRGDLAWIHHDAIAVAAKKSRGVLSKT